MSDDTKRLQIYGGKASIKPNKFGVWQFRMWVNSEKRYYEKSLRTKRRLDAIELAEARYIDIQNEIKNGKKLFSFTIKQAVEVYLAHRAREAKSGVITEGRYKTITTHLSHFISYVGGTEKAANLGIQTLVRFEHGREETNYVLWRTNQKAAKQTIRNEMATINACQRYLFEIENIVNVPRFVLPNLKISGGTTKSGEEVRRMTFEKEEWKSFYTALRSYAAKVKNKLTDNETYERELVRHWCLFAANSGLRSGEQRQLTWGDVSVVKDKHNGEEISLAKVNVRGATSKVGKARIFWCMGAEYLQRWKKLQKEYGGNDKGLIFSLDGLTEYERYRLHRHWKAVMLLSSISVDKRKRLVPYSLRHLAITNMYLSGVSLSDIAFYCGTSVKQIEGTYYHLREEKMKSVATARLIKRDGKTYAVGQQLVDG